MGGLLLTRLRRTVSGFTPSGTCTVPLMRALPTYWMVKSTPARSSPARDGDGRCL
jgi:hypothetical protein